MTTVDEKEILEIEKLKLEIDQFLKKDHKLEDKKYRNDLYKSFLLFFVDFLVIIGYNVYYKNILVILSSPQDRLVLLKCFNCTIS